MEISIAAEELFHIGAFPITNAFLTTLVVSASLIVGSLVLRGRLRPVPVGLQNAAEAVIEKLWDLTESVAGDRELGKRFFPLVATIFLFVLFSNWLGLLPGMGTFGLQHGEALHSFVRAGSADLNMTLALSLISVFAVQFTGIGILGVMGYAKKFLVSPFHKPYVIGTFVGLLELAGEVTKIISFSFRLFGNIFAGEVLLIVIGHLVPYFVPLPFLFLEVFVGLVQAGIFAILTLVFLKMATIEAAH